jgi:transposase
MPRTAPQIDLDPGDRVKLERLVRSLSTPQGLALRARIVLAAAERLSNQQIAEKLGATAATIGKWRTHFCNWGMSALEPSKFLGRPSKSDSKVKQRLCDLVCQRPHHGKRRWTVRMLATCVDLSPSTVHDMLGKVKLPRSRYAPWRRVRA